MKQNMIFGTLLFFIVFFRLSILSPHLYLAFIPAFFGSLYFISDISQKIQSGEVYLRKNDFLLFTVFMIIFSVSILFDSFQKEKTFQSLFTVRILMLFFFSFIPAYFLIKKYLHNDKNVMEKIVIISLWIQVIIFFITYMIPGAKKELYDIFGMADSVNLWKQNLKIRGFGLSGEINFMTPFLMIYISFFLIKRQFLLMAIVCSTQIINSNMAVFAVLIGIAFSKVNINIKLAAVLLISILIYSLGTIFFPRFYDEFISSGGTRTLDILLQRHVFAVAPLDLFNIIFGFQYNISSSIPDLSHSSDMGWVILFNYGGIVFILLFLVLLLSLSIAAFGFTYMAALWFLVGIILNTKGLVLGGNSYFFISFIYFFLNRESYPEKYLNSELIRS